MNYYLDCEFNSFKGVLLTLALVREDGKMLYLGYDTGYTVLDPWVEANVFPIISKGPIPCTWGIPNENAVRLQEYFQGDSKPRIIADWPDDIKYFCEAIITGPGTMINIPGLTFEVVRIDAYPTALPGALQHNALWDALALRHALLS